MSAQVDVNAILEACEAYVDDAASFPEHFKPGLVKRHQSQYREARDAVAALIAERDALQERLNTNRCNRGHETLPLTLWDCPECHNETRRERDALREALLEILSGVDAARLGARPARRSRRGVQSIIDNAGKLECAEPEFVDWLAKEMPAGTVIGDPAWWANRIARQYSKRSNQPAPVVDDADATEILALSLDEFGYHTEARNVRAGEDLDEYRTEMWAIRAALARAHGVQP